MATTTRTRRRRTQARITRAVNGPMRLVLGLPFPTPLGRRLLLANLVGRKTGRRYRQPLSYVGDGAGALLTPGGGRWTRNVVAGRPLVVRLNGRDVTVVPEIVTDPDSVDRLLAVIETANPVAGRFVGIRRGADGRLDPDRFGPALAHGLCVVRWHLDGAPADDPARAAA